MKGKIELELKDYKEMEEISTDGIRTGMKMIIASQTSLDYAEKMIRAMGEEPERARILRIKTEEEVSREIDAPEKDTFR